MSTSNMVDIATACSRRGIVNVVGVVVDKMPMRQFKNSSPCVTFTIKDTDLDAPHWQGGLKIRYFNEYPNVLPDPKVNDVVILRGVRVSMFNGRPTGTAKNVDTIPWAIFRANPDPTSEPSSITGPGPYELHLTQYERRVAQSLLSLVAPDELQMPPKSARRAHASQQPSQVVQASVSSARQGGTPIVAIRDMQVRRIVQLIGQVVRLNDYDSEKTILYITDYTENPALAEFKKDDEDDMNIEGDQYNYMNRRAKRWPGPWGRLNLQVTLWEPHASFARENVREGDLVHLTYVRIKEGLHVGMEAAVHEDRRDSKKVHVRVISADFNEQAQELMSRKEAYWKIRGKPGEDSKKTEKKKKKKTEQKKEARAEEGQRTLPASASLVKKNPRIVVRDYGAATRSTESILSGESHNIPIPNGITYQLPFQNVCYRLLVRVVDFFPPKLEDFAVEVPMSSIVNHGYPGMNDGTSNQRTEWQWRFCLLVEGTEPKISKDQPRELMKIYVVGGEGEHLLNLTATDLRRHASRLDELRERIWTLWGNLEEAKQEQIATANSGDDRGWEPPTHSSLPFECCIKEYGVRCPHPADTNAMLVDGLDEHPCSHPDCFGWERRFAMFGTRIYAKDRE